MSVRELSGPYLSSFLAELSLCLKAGISLNEGVSMLAEDETDREIKEMLNGLYSQMDKGASFETALAAAGCFPKYVVDMVAIGSKTGRLEDVTKALSDYYVRQEEISSEIRNAVVYPLVLLLMLLIVTGVLVIKVLPVFNDVYRELGAQMSSVAVTAMNIGAGITKYSAVILSLVAVIVLIGFFISYVPSLSLKFSNFWNKLTSGRRINRKISSARFAAGMAMTLASGLDTDESLDMVERITYSPVMLDRIEECRRLMTEGELFADAVSKAGIFPEMYCRMLKIGFKTGSADTVMDEIAKKSEDEVNENIESVINKVEPSLVIIMSLIVGVILLSVMLPLMSIMTAIG